MLNKTLNPDPLMTYNHMGEEGAKEKSSKEGLSRFRDKLVLRFIAEELIIAFLLALIFYMI